MWILTYEENDYNQHGEYFLAAWSNKPSIEQLEKVLKADKSEYTIEEVYQNCGRLRSTRRWYNFFHYENP